ncbi:cell division ATP-binding protein FtsE [Rathayibacter rathayi]|uniref:Cell division ATP-binding protein FtsE n=1 Tax=Rathayibacter rathayi TaxID=33887 RepID=A0ABX5A9K5_RATRA|nr:cell division ATP-binding protein FtsE [Rathayibacter rathayi]AZZ48404.1 cell division ATP-binding protein FtsE [Rathayibacter rathayi]MWV74311.1 cell division ATP-binding protein FtsE [Rathayibacter rathayi NCPPB 2980 = VKM Ac-1601]PPF47601.1 cell division ATP-binding protein FtsE [Rathayibacter rathayi]PPF78807.1 cell division ATP-binding protein FtsE [Rathayibacter rathayi]PPG41011.1 cell division ATP-binding protein FtsE [Rathayibacter rathayi]
MIRFDNVSKQYRGGTRPALNAIDLEILRGEFVFLVGASGSGKSSCLRLILKEERPSSGSIHVLGQNLGKISSRKVPYFRRNMGVVFQDFRLLPNKSVFDNVAFSLQVIGKSKGYIQEAVPDTLKMVGLAGKASRLPHELSGGEQQRVAIARAVVNKPAVLLADEPTGNLDPTTSAGIMALLERINAGGTTVIMATHEAGIVDQMKRRVIELSAGSIVRDESQGGYGQTESITVVHDGVVVVAADDHALPEHPSPPAIIDSELAPAEVPELDLRQAAPVVEPEPTPLSQTAAQARVPEGRRAAAPAESEREPEPTQESAATARVVELQSQTGPIFLPADTGALPEESLAARLGLRAHAGEGDETGDDQQNVGPVK